MSIRMVAVELYRVMKEIERLEERSKGLDPGSSELEACRRKLREARAEQTRLKNMLEGAKY